MTVGEILSSNSSTSTEGFSYRTVPSGWLTSTHILTINPQEYRFTPVRAENGRETVGSIASRVNALAAVNGGFWKADGTPAGILKIDGVWHGTPVKPRGAIGWEEGGENVLMDRLLTRSESGETVPVPLNNPDSANEWKNLPHIVGGTPLLIANGVPVEDFAPEKTIEKFLTNRHARTAVGIKENGDAVLVVVDAYFYNFFGGMTMRELQKFMGNLGCVNALNLDGGKSSTMVVGGKVVNFPSGWEKENGTYEKRVSDAIVVLKG